jgi:hypothetical protein
MIRHYNLRPALISEFFEDSKAKFGIDSYRANMKEFFVSKNGQAITTSVIFYFFEHTFYKKSYKNRHLPSGKSPSLILPMRTRLRPFTFKPMASHMRLTCRFFPSIRTNLN